MTGVRSRGTLAVAAAMLVLLLPGRAEAQGQGDPGGGRTKIKISLNQNAISFPTPSYVDFDAGYVEAASMVVSVQPRPNQAGPWELRIQAGAPDMGGYGKPVGDILWRRSGSTTWNTLSTTEQIVLQGTGVQDITFFFRLRLDYAQDAPNSYSADVSFSALTL